MTFWNTLIPRSKWGARFANGYGDRTKKYPLASTVLHHTVTLHLSANATQDEEEAQMRVIEGIGQSRFGGGFSYNLAIFPSGRAYQGLGFSRVGAHTGGQNSTTMGIVLVGNYQNTTPTAAQQAKLVEALQAMHAAGITRTARITQGHRQVSQTACPGDRAFNLIPTINNRATGAPVSASKPSAPATTPKPAPKPVQASTKPRAAGSGPWPDAYLTVTGRRNSFQDKALENLLDRIGVDRKVRAMGLRGTFAQKLQRHLRAAGYYKGTITNQSAIGPQTVRAWQLFLRDRKFYTGAIDGSWGPATVRGTVNFLNWQAEVIKAS